MLCPGAWFSYNIQFLSLAYFVDVPSCSFCSIVSSAGFASTYLSDAYPLRLVKFDRRHVIVADVSDRCNFQSSSYLRWTGPSWTVRHSRFLVSLLLTRSLQQCTSLIIDPSVIFWLVLAPAVHY